MKTRLRGVSGLAALVLVAAVFDVRLKRIPNWLCATGLVLGLVLNFRFMQFAGLRQAGLGAALALAVYFPLFALRAMGGGDVKLMAAIGALAGPSNWFITFVLTALFGGVCAISLLVIRGDDKAAQDEKEIDEKPAVAEERHVI